MNKTGIHSIWHIDFVGILHQICIFGDGPVFRCVSISRTYFGPWDMIYIPKAMNPNPDLFCDGTCKEHLWDSGTPWFPGNFTPKLCELVFCCCCCRCCFFLHRLLLAIDASGIKKCFSSGFAILNFRLANFKNPDV